MKMYINDDRFDAERARFYSSEILLALKFLHRKGIIYRYHIFVYQVLSVVCGYIFTVTHHTDFKLKKNIPHFGAPPSPTIISRLDRVAFFRM